MPKDGSSITGSSSAYFEERIEFATFAAVVEGPKEALADVEGSLRAGWAVPTGILRSSRRLSFRLPLISLGLDWL